MIQRLKKIIGIGALIAIIAIVPLFANAQVQNNTWKVISNVLQPVLDAWGVKIPSLGSAGNPCVNVNSVGLLGTTTCGSGGGTGTTTLLVGNGFLYTATSTDSIRAAFFVGTSTTATSTFVNASTTNFSILGKLFDNLGSSGSIGNLLVNTGTSQKWQATSTLGIALSDTIGTLATTRGGTGITSYTTGDTLYSSATNVLSKLAIGSTGNWLSVSGGVPVWRATSTLGVAFSDTTGTVPTTRGGTNITSYTTGDLLYSSATNVLSKRTIGTTGDVLSVVGGLPTWVATSTLGISGGGGGGWTDDGTVVRLTTNTDSVGIGTATPNNRFQVNGGNVAFDFSPSTLYTVGDSANAAAVDNGYVGGGYTANGYSHTYRIWAYRIVDSVQFFSTNYTESNTFTDDSSTNMYNVDVAWDAVANADGYRVLVQDDVNGYAYDYYRDVATNALTDDNTGWTAGSTVTPDSYTSVDTAGFMYASTTQNVGIGVIDPVARLAINTTTGDNVKVAIGDNEATVIYPGWDSQQWTTIDLVRNNPTSLSGASALTFTNNLASPDGTYDAAGIVTFVNKASANADLRIAMIFGGFDNASDGNIQFWTTSSGSISEKARISSVGNFGISAPAPANRLTVGGAGSIGASYIGTAAPTNGLIVEGQTGIGSSTPISTLSVKGTAGTNLFTVASSTNSKLFEINQSGATLFANSAGTTGQLLQSNGTGASPTWVSTSTLSSGLTRVTATTTGPTAGVGNTATLTVNCPGAFKVYGGGGSIASNANGAVLQNSYPASTTAWTVDYYATLGIGASGTITGYAMCQ